MHVITVDRSHSPMPASVYVTAVCPHQRRLSTGKRNIPAYAIPLQGITSCAQRESSQTDFYNPFEYDTFFRGQF